MSLRLKGFALAALAIVVGMPTSLPADQWTGWMGDQRDGVYRPDGKVALGPESEILWKLPIGGGYAGPAVADGKVFVFDYQLESGEVQNDPGQRVNLGGRERLIAIDAATGQEIWQHSYDCPYSISYPAGPRCTPTVDGDRVYTLGSEGDLRCIKVSDGSLIWKTNFKTDFAAEVPIWGFASHPLVVGDLIYTMVGGDGQGVVAFDKMSGKVRWKSLDARAGYCPPSIIQIGGVKQLMIYHPEGVVSLNPVDGSEYWSLPITPDFDMSINHPVVEGTRMYVSGIRSVALMIELDSAKPSAKEQWYGEPKQAVHCANSTPMFVDGVVYGTDCIEGSLMAVDAADGSRLWKTFEATQPEEERLARHGTAFLTRIGETDQYLLFSEIGDLILAELTRDGYKELGRKHILEPTGEAFGRDVVWSHPAYVDGIAYARNDDEIVAVSLGEKAK